MALSGPSLHQGDSPVLVLSRRPPSEAPASGEHRTGAHQWFREVDARWATRRDHDVPDHGQGNRVPSADARGAARVGFTTSARTAASRRRPLSRQAGAAEFRMPWHHDGTSTSRPINIASNKPYRGINTLALWASATRAGFAGGIWGTYQQWNAKGAQVRRGEHGTTVVLWKIDNRCDQREDDNEADEGDGRHRVFAPAYTVFNASQVDGYTSPEVPAPADSDPIDRAERFCATLRIQLLHPPPTPLHPPTPH